MSSENDEIGFVYSFDMGKEIPHFRHMPGHIQSSAESNVVNVIYESFVVPGDQDYLMSRLLAQKGLPRGFYWAAAQATEKYLKALLLMNGEGVKEFTAHSIRKLFEAACKVDASLNDIDILPHQSIKIDDDLSHHLKKFAVLDYIKELEKHGNADNRYNAFGVQYNTGHLYALDSLLFQLRKRIGVINLNESFKKLSLDLIRVFKKNNPWFYAKENNIEIRTPSEEFPIIYSSSVTKLEFLIENENSIAYGLALQWLKAKMKIPKIVGKSK